MRFFTMVNLSVIAFSLICLAAIMSGADSTPVNCRSDKFLNRKVGKWRRSVSFPLMHLYSECSPFRPPNRTWESLMSHKIRADANRLLFLKRTPKVKAEAEDANANVPVMPGSGEYIIQVDFGTPKQSMHTLIDTGSDVAYIPCKPCEGCDSIANQSLFDSAASSSYQSLACDSQECQEISSTSCGENSECEMQLKYGDGSHVEGVLSTDAITLASQSLPNFSFLCAENVNGDNQPGLMGLGGGSLSLLNQPTADLFGQTFSYCLPSLESSASSGSGSLVLGKEAALSSTSALQFTKLIKDSSEPTFYYVNLLGISVGNTTVTVETTSIASGGGTIIDSGTTITHLVAPTYRALRDAFREQIPNMQVTSDELFDTCYDMSSSSVAVPSITLHLDGNVDLALANENILYNAGSGLMCLAFTSNSDSDSTSIIGNVQQQNWRVVFDIPNSQVGFAQEQCTAA